MCGLDAIGDGDQDGDRLSRHRKQSTDDCNRNRTDRARAIYKQPLSDDRIAHEIAVNLTGTILLTRRLLPLLRSGRNPLIVMISSGYALLPATRAPTYSATKAGLHSFAMALRRQLSDVGIRVVEVMPPLIDTPATRAERQPKGSRRCRRMHWSTACYAISEMDGMRSCPEKSACCRF